MRLADWLTSYLSTRLGLSSGYEDRLRETVDRWTGPAELSAIDASAVNAWLRGLSRTLSAVSLNNRRRMLLTLLGAAADAGHMPAIRSRQVGRAKEIQTEPTGWTIEEVRRLIATAARWPKCGPMFAALTLTVYYTGERIGALLACRVPDYEAGVLRVPGAARKDRRSRSYTLPLDASEAVESQRCAASGALFFWPHGRRWFFRQFHAIVVAAGLTVDPKVGLFHRIRRTSGSLVEARGGDGAKHLGNTRRVFESRYLAPRICAAGQRPDLLPRVS